MISNKRFFQKDLTAIHVAIYLMSVYTVSCRLLWMKADSVFALETTVKMRSKDNEKTQKATWSYPNQANIIQILPLSVYEIKKWSTYGSNTDFLLQNSTFAFQPYHKSATINFWALEIRLKHLSLLTNINKCAKKHPVRTCRTDTAIQRVTEVLATACCTHICAGNPFWYGFIVIPCQMSYKGPTFFV